MLCSQLSFYLKLLTLLPRLVQIGFESFARRFYAEFACFMAEFHKNISGSYKILYATWRFKVATHNGFSPTNVLYDFSSILFTELKGIGIMMNIDRMVAGRYLSALLLFMSLVLCTRLLAADGAMLYDSSGFIARENESKVLSAAEITAVEEVRKNKKDFKSLVVASINKISLERTGLITLILSPKGKRYQFMGQGKLVDGSKDIVWIGKDKDGAIFSIGDDNEGTFGTLHDLDRVFQIYSLPGKRFYAIVEAVRHPLEEPEFDGKADSNLDGGRATKMQGK
jgi:hypothetical protein